MRIRPIALPALALGGLAALWYHSQSLHHSDAEFFTHANPDGSLRWVLTMPADRWREIRKAAGDNVQGEDRALRILIAMGFDATGINADGCRIVAVSTLAFGAKEKIEGSCQPSGAAGASL